MSNETVHPSTAHELCEAVLQQLPRNISQKVALGLIRNKKVFGKVLREALFPPTTTVFAVQKTPRSLLELVCTVDISAQDPFNAADFFKEYQQRDKIEFMLTTNFEKNLLRDCVDLVDIPVPGTTFNAYTLTADSMNGLIVATLDDTDAAKSTIADVAYLIKAQPKGEKGALLTNGRINTFYVEDLLGNLLVVRCCWLVTLDAWIIMANPIEHSDISCNGCRIFSPAVLAS